MIDSEIEKEAIEYVKRNKKDIIDKFANLDDFPSEDFPFTFIMAGSPGAGKTEYSLKLIEEFYQNDPESKIVRIDADEIKTAIPQYNGKNSYIIQSAAIKGMEMIIDHIYDHNQNVLIDGTFAHYPASIKNIQRSLNHRRPVKIWYLYLDPKMAWDFTRKREKLEGRPIKKESFINSFFLAKDNVNKVKKQFGNEVELNLVIKDIANPSKIKLQLNIDNVDKFLTIGYNRDQLNKILI